MRGYASGGHGPPDGGCPYMGENNSTENLCVKIADPKSCQSKEKHRSSNIKCSRTSDLACTSYRLSSRSGVVGFGCKACDPSTELRTGRGPSPGCRLYELEAAGVSSVPRLTRDRGVRRSVTKQAGPNVTLQSRGGRGMRNAWCREMRIFSRVSGYMSRWAVLIYAHIWVCK